MGTYWYAVNLDRKEYFSGHTLDEGAKPREFLEGRGAPHLAALLAGRWCEDKVGIFRDPDLVLDPDSGFRELSAAELAAAMDDAL